MEYGWERIHSHYVPVNLLIFISRLGVCVCVCRGAQSSMEAAAEILLI